MDLLTWIIVGLVAGVLASLVMGGTGFGIIGDIHGCLRAFSALLDAVKPRDDDLLVALGVDEHQRDGGLLDDQAEVVLGEDGSDGLDVAGDFEPPGAQAGREAVGASTDWASVAGYCGLLVAFAAVCLALATKAFGAYQKQV